MQELQESTGKVVQKLDAKKAKTSFKEPKVNVTEQVFRWEMNQDAMATEKLAEGIRKFSEDLVALEEIIKERLADFIKASPNKKKGTKRGKK